MVEHPAECVIFAPCIGNDAAAFRRPVALGIRNSLAFRGCIPTAHTLAYLRFAHAVTDTSARLATDPPGSALIGRVSHPLDDSSKFPEVIASFLSIGPASLGRTRPRQWTHFLDTLKPIYKGSMGRYPVNRIFCKRGPPASRGQPQPPASKKRQTRARRVEHAEHEPGVVGESRFRRNLIHQDTNPVNLDCGQ